jgi:hypothetical protein
MLRGLALLYVETPGDINGIVYTPLDERQAGYAIDMNKI